MNKQVIVADSTQIQAFVECERIWNYGHALRLTAHAGRPNEAMLMGTLGHKYLERYYKGASIDQALEWNPDTELCECGHAMDLHIAQSGTCMSIEGCRCPLATAKQFPLDTLRRNEVRQRVREYCYTYAANDIVPASADAVEVGFSHNLYEDEDYLFVLEGKMDISDGLISGMPCIVDHKFQLRRHDIYKKSIQFRNYAMVRRASMLVINYIRLTKGISKDTFVRDIASFTEPEHDWWRGELITIYKRMARAVWGDKTGESNPYEPTWSSCSGRFGYACEFTPLCEELNPQLKEMKQQTMYSIKPVWRPW